jgi:hypothetical protein
MALSSYSGEAGSKQEKQKDYLDAVQAEKSDNCGLILKPESIVFQIRLDPPLPIFPRPPWL